MLDVGGPWQRSRVTQPADPTEPAAVPAAPAPPPATLRSFWHDLPREGRLLLSIVVIEFLGTGLVLPFAVVYLHEVRGFALSDVGLLLGIAPLVGMAVAGPGGAVIDRLGARPVVLTSLVLTMASDVLLTFATVLPVAAAALVLSGLAGGAMWPAFQSMTAAVVPSELRQRYFGLNFTLLNLGIGLGGLVGGVFVDVHRAWTFQAIYLADAASFLPAVGLLLGPLRHQAGRPAQPEHVTEPGSYRAVVRLPAIPGLLLLTFVVAFVGYGQLNAGLQAYARDVGEVSTQALGLAYAANTAVIVLLQLAILRRIEGHRRTRVMGLMGLLWSASWLILGASGLAPGGWGAAFAVTACASVFALGETLMQPTLPALTNDLAPDHLRGRVNALASIFFQLAAVVAPVSAGWLIGHGLGSSYIALLVVGSLSVAVVGVRLERRLPPGVNGVHSAALEHDDEKVPAGDR